MNWDEINSVWKQQTSGGTSARDMVALERVFRARQQKAARTLFWRDLREAAAGLFVAAVFAGVAWQIGSTAWPIAFAIALMLGLTGFFAYERVRAARRAPAIGTSLLARLDAEIAEQRHQRLLLVNVCWWYLAPCAAAVGIFGATTLHAAPIPLPAKLGAAVLMGAVIALSFWGVFAINRRAVRRDIEPRLQELETLRQTLAAPE